MATKKLTMKQQLVRDEKKGYSWGRCADGTPRKKPGRRSGDEWKRVQAEAKRRKARAAKKGRRT